LVVKNQVGPVRKSFSVRFTDDSHLKLQAQGTLKSRITWQPGHPILNSAAESDDRSQLIALDTDADLPAITITGVAAGRPELKPRVIEEREGHSWKIALSIDSRLPAGRIDDVLTVRTTDPVQSVLSIPVTVISAGRVTGP
jgi:hypothetical protein